MGRGLSGGNSSTLLTMNKVDCNSPFFTTIEAASLCTVSFFRSVQFAQMIKRHAPGILK
jgi:hypothetical protein